MVCTSQYRWAGTSMYQCIEAINLSQVQMDRDGMFDDPEYIKKLESNSPNQTKYYAICFCIIWYGNNSICRTSDELEEWEISDNSLTITILAKLFLSIKRG